MAFPIPVPSLHHWLSSRWNKRENAGEGGRSSRGHGDLVVRRAALYLPWVGTRIPVPFCLCWQRAPCVCASTHLAPHQPQQGGWPFVRDYSFPGASLKEPLPSSHFSLTSANLVPCCSQSEHCPARVILIQALRSQRANCGQDEVFMREVCESHYGLL